MNLMEMLPLLMMMGNKKGGSGSMDPSTMMQLFSMMNGNNFFGTQNSNNGTPNYGKPLNMDMSNLTGMLSPEMLKILGDLGRKN